MALGVKLVPSNPECIRRQNFSRRGQKNNSIVVCTFSAPRFLCTFQTLAAETIHFRFGACHERSHQLVIMQGSTLTFAKCGNFPSLHFETNRFSWWSSKQTSVGNQTFFRTGKSGRGQALKCSTKFQATVFCPFSHGIACTLCQVI